MKNMEVALSLILNGQQEVSSKLDKLQTVMKVMAKTSPDPKVKNEINAITKGVDLLNSAINKAGKEAKGASKELDEVSKRARVENLREVSESIRTLSDVLINVGRGVIQTAANFEALEAKMLTAAKGNKQLRDELMAFAKQSASSTPYTVQQVMDAIVKLQAYGFEAKKVFKNVGDLAAAYGKDLSQAVEAVADAQTGELERLKEFTITKQQLIEKAREMFGKEIVDAKGQITDLQAMNEALFSIMEERASGAMDRMMNTYAGAISNFKDAVSQLQEGLGGEVLPKLTDFVKWAGSVVSAFNSLDQGTKNVISNLGFFTVAIVGIGGKLVSTIIQIQAFTASLEASQIAMLGFAGVAAGIGIAIGVVANSYIDAWRKMEEQKSKKIEEETKRIAGGFKNVKEAIELVNKTPVEIALDPKIEEKIASLEERIKAIREAAAGNLDTEGKTFSFELTDSSDDATDRTWVRDFEMSYTKGMDFLLQKQEELNKKLSETGLPEEVTHKYKSQLAEINLEIKRLYETLEKENPEMYKRQIDMLEGSLAKAEQGKEIADGEKAGKAFYEGFNKAKEEAQKKSDLMLDKSGLKLQDINDTELNAKIQHQKTLLELNRQATAQFVANLEDYKTKYKLTQEEMDKIDLEVFRAKEKQASEEKKINDEKIKEADRVSKEQAAKAKKYQEEWEKSQKEKAAAEEEAWRKTIQVQAETLEAEGKTVEAKKLLLKTKEKDLRDSGVAETEIVKWKEAQIQKIEADGLEEAKKKAKEKLKANKEIEEAIAGLSESTVERQISSIKKQAEEWEKSGADIIKIEEYKNKAIQKFQEETFQDFKQKEDQKKKEIEDTAKTIQSINDKIAANNQKIKDLESGSSFGGGSPLMSHEEALSKSFSEHLDPYIEKLEQSKALEQENQALMSERDKAFQKEQEQQSELKKIQEERNTAQDAFNTALQGTVDKYSAVSQTSPWEAEKKKIEEATAAAEKYNSVTSGGGEGSSSDADKKDGEPKKYYPGDNVGEKDGEPKKYYPGDNVGEKDSTSKLKPGDPGYIYGSDVGNYGGGNLPGKSTQGQGGNLPGKSTQGQGGNLPGKSTQGQGGNLPSNYTKGGFSTNTSSIANPYAGQFGTGNAPQSPQPSVNPSRSNQGWDWTPNYSTFGDLGSWGFDNPANDTMAFKAMEKMTSDFAIPVVAKSMKDMVMNMLGGMVSSVSNIVNTPSYSTTNSQVSNYKSTTNVTNYNTSLDNKQIATAMPVERNVRELNSLIQKFRKPS